MSCKWKIEIWTRLVIQKWEFAPVCQVKKPELALFWQVENQSWCKVDNCKFSMNPCLAINNQYCPESDKWKTGIGASLAGHCIIRISPSLTSKKSELAQVWLLWNQYECTSGKYKNWHESERSDVPTTWSSIRWSWKKWCNCVTKQSLLGEQN